MNIDSILHTIGTFSVWVESQPMSACKECILLTIGLISLWVESQPMSAYDDSILLTIGPPFPHELACQVSVTYALSLGEISTSECLQKVYPTYDWSAIST